MGKKYDFKYIVIGSGPAGSTAALTLAKSKKRVALVESRHYGGLLIFHTLITNSAHIPNSEIKI